MFGGSLQPMEQPGESCFSLPCSDDGGRLKVGSVNAALRSHQESQAEDVASRELGRKAMVLGCLEKKEKRCDVPRFPK